MNAPLALPRLPDTTQACDGMPRRAFSIAEIEAMVAAGIIAEEERFELIGGDVVPMSPKGAFHETVKIALNEHFQAVRTPTLTVAQETTLRLDKRAFLEPDFCVFPRALPIERLSGAEVLLAVEIADSSLAYDLGRKIGVYAAYGVREVWVIDARRLVTRRHRRLGAEGYGDIADLGPAETLTPGLAPELALSLAGLGLEPLSPDGATD